MRDPKHPQERSVLSTSSGKHGEPGYHAANGRAVLQDSVLRDKEADGVVTEYGLCRQSQAGKAIDEIDGVEDLVPGAEYQRAG